MKLTGSIEKKMYDLIKKQGELPVFDDNNKIIGKAYISKEGMYTVEIFDEGFKKNFNKKEDVSIGFKDNM